LREDEKFVELGGREESDPGRDLRFHWVWLALKINRFVSKLAKKKTMGCWMKCVIGWSTEEKEIGVSACLLSILFYCV